MKEISFFDTTLRDGEQTVGVNFSVEQKVSIAKALDEWGIEVIEAGFPRASNEDLLAVKEVSKVVKSAAVTGLARLNRKDIDAAVESVAEAGRPMIHLFIATSPVHRESKLHMNKEQILDKIAADVDYARKRMPHVIFSPEDATRTEDDFLIKAVQTAIDFGADRINIPDTVGYSTPEEFGMIFKLLKDRVKGSDQIIWSAHTHNDLGMANANALSAIEHGADEVQGTINGIGERAGNSDLIETAAALKVRQDYFQAHSSINLKMSKKISNIVANAAQMPVPKNKAVTGTNAFSHESGIHQDGFLKNPKTYQLLDPADVGMSYHLPLGKLSGSHALFTKLASLGYDIDRNQSGDIFKIFKKSAEKTDIVTDQMLKQMMKRYQENFVKKGEF